MSTEQALALADVPSRGAHPGVRTAARLDPYWDGLWSSGALANWLNVETARRQVRAGLGTMPSHLDMTKDQAWKKFTSSHNWRRKLEVLGTVLSWRTLSAQQLAAFVGAPSMARHSAVPAAAFASGLLDVGQFPSGLSRTAANTGAQLYRPARSDAFDNQLAPSLTYPEQVLVTGGRQYRTGAQYDRHNLLTAELALRASEFCTIGTVLGEAYASVDLLVGSGIGRDPILKRNMSADAVIVRPDGLRIAVEVTASTSASFRDKVKRWCEHMADASLETSGLTVMFVCAPPPDRGYERGDFVNRVRTMVKQVVAKFPGGVPGHRVADRIMVSSWEDYFPGPGLVHPGFFTLRAYRTDGKKDSTWAPVGLLDEFDFPFAPHSPAAMQAVIDNAAAVACAPVWLRRAGQVPPVHMVQLERAQVGHLPTPPPRRKSRRVEQGHTARQGTGVKTRVAPRLRSSPSADEPH